MRVRLDVIRGPHRGKSFLFDGHDNFIVGRAAYAHFRLAEKDPFFSRVHFMLEVNPPHCRLVDMGSLNGTGVNGQRATTADLKHGDLIQGGDTVLKVFFLAERQDNKPDPASGGHAPDETLRRLGGTPSDARSGAVADERPKPVPVALAETVGFEGAGVSSVGLPAIPGYRVIRELGRGGMGTVYQAERMADARPFAIKTISPGVVASEQDVQRFLREADVLRQLDHPNIVAFRELGSQNDVLFFVMDYVPGFDAGQLLEKHGPLDIVTAVRITCQVLDALEYAHRNGFVHRDVKPANVLVAGDPGRELCKLADFGLARVYHASPLSGLTMLGDTGGTVAFMPPEQVTDYRNVRPVSDVYSTAAMLYFLLTKQHVFDFQRSPKAHWLSKILTEAPIPIRERRTDIPDSLANAIQRALAKDVAKRFTAASEFRRELTPFAGQT